MTYPNDLLSAEDKAAVDLEKEFLRSVKATVKQIDWDKLEQDLTAHQAGEDIVNGLPWEEYDPEKALKNLFEVALEAHGEYIGSVIGGAIFDYVDPNALKWIEKYGAQDIKYISDASKDAIRSIIRNGYENGVTVRKQARQIREHIGLDPDRSRTLEKYAENLFAKGKSEAEVWQLVEKRAKSLLTARANTIAVNEASEAAGRATYQSTKSAVERGVIDPNLYEGFRIVTADERTCEICNAVAGETRKLPDGVYPSSGSQIAKKHTRCRCVEGLRESTKSKKSPSDKVDRAQNGPASNQSPKLTDVINNGKNPEMQAAIKYYTGEGYRDINHPLRHGDELSDVAQEHMEWLDAIVEDDRAALRAGKVYRGYDNESFLLDEDDDLIGSTIQDPAFVSVSHNEENAKVFLNTAKHPVMAEIRIPEGAKGYAIPSDMTAYDVGESEVLLPRDSEFEVLSREERGGFTWVVLQLLV